MTDQGRPLSRRERREAEERAAAALAEQGTVVPDAVAPQTEATAAAPEAISRRERRRLERLADPMETWTAEEETAATGQIPTMTPEVIAQQEEIARLKAQEAAQDALLATGAIPQVTERVSAVESPEATIEPEVAVEPVSPALLSFAEELPVATPVPTRAPASEQASPSLSATLPSFDALLNEEQAGARSADAPSESALVETPFDDGIPEAFRHMFPKASLQGSTGTTAPTPVVSEPAAPEALLEVPFDYESVQQPSGERSAQSKYDEMYGAPSAPSSPSASEATDEQIVVPELVMPTLATPKVERAQEDDATDSPRVMKPPPPAAPLGSAIGQARAPLTSGSPVVPQFAPSTSPTPSVAPGGPPATQPNPLAAPSGAAPFTGATPAVQPQGGAFAPGQQPPAQPGGAGYQGGAVQQPATGQQQSLAQFAPVGMPPQTGATPVQQGVAPYPGAQVAGAPLSPQNGLQAPQMPISQAIPVQMEEAGGIRHWKVQHIAAVGAVAFVMGVVVYTVVVSP